LGLFEPPRLAVVPVRAIEEHDMISTIVLNLVGNETGIVVNAAFIAANHNGPAGELGKCVVVFGATSRRRIRPLDVPPWRFALGWRSRSMSGPL